MDQTTVTAVMKEKNDQELAALEAEILKGSSPTNDSSATSQDDATTSDSPSASEETNPVPATEDTTEEALPKTDSTPVQEAVDTDSDLTEQELKRLSEKAHKRYSNITRENRELKEQIARLTGITKQPEQPTQAKTTLPWELPEADNSVREISPEEYQQEIERKAREVVQRELASQRMVDTLHNDIAECERRYPELNPVSEVFDDELAGKIVNWYKAQHATNPHLRMLDFVSDVMSLRTKAASVAKKQVTGKVVQQANNQALGPSPTTVTSKSIEDLISQAKSTDELKQLESMFS